MDTVGARQLFSIVVIASLRVVQWAESGGVPPLRW
jgi:hypothetical protein